MTAEQQQNIGKALVEIADKLRTVGEGLLVADEPKKKATKPKAEPKPEEVSSDTKQYTLEDVRAVLADKSRAGHTSEVKDLISKYGADRLSAVDSSNYAALMADSEVIGNE